MPLILQPYPFRIGRYGRSKETWRTGPAILGGEQRKTDARGFKDLAREGPSAKTDPTQIEVAEQQILQGINLLEELGIVAFSGWGYLWLGEVYTEAGRPEEALAPLKKAEAMFRQMGMDYWLGKAQTALARL